MYNFFSLRLLVYSAVPGLAGSRSVSFSFLWDSFRGPGLRRGGRGETRGVTQVGEPEGITNLPCLWAEGGTCLNPPSYGCYVGTNTPYMTCRYLFSSSLLLCFVLLPLVGQVRRGIGSRCGSATAAAVPMQWRSRHHSPLPAFNLTRQQRCVFFFCCVLGQERQGGWGKAK